MTRILIIEDSEVLKVTVTRVIKKLDPAIDIVWLTSNEEAMNLLNTDKEFNLIIADINTEGSKTGIDLFKYVADSNIKVPVAIMSSTPKIDFEFQCEQTDVSPLYFLEKPFTVQQLKDVMLKAAKIII